MSSYKERFLSSFNAIEEKREEIANQKRLEAERIEKEKVTEEKEKNQLLKKCAENIFSRNKATLIDSTLDSFLSKVEACSKPPYKVTYNLEENILFRGASSLLEKMIETSLKNELPNIPQMVLKVSVHNHSIRHGHEEGDWRSGRWVHDYTEYRLIIEISINF